MAISLPLRKENSLSVSLVGELRTYLIRFSIVNELMKGLEGRYVNINSLGTTLQPSALAHSFITNRSSSEKKKKKINIKVPSILQSFDVALNIAQKAERNTHTKIIEKNSV